MPPAARQLQPDRGNAKLKFLDRTVGIPVVVTLGGFRNLRGRRAVPDDWRTIGLMKLAGIGDTVLLSAIVADIRETRPDARIVIFVNASNVEFARLLDDVDAVVELPVRNVPEAIQLVRTQQCDVLVDFGAWARLETILTVSSGARATVGMRTHGQHRHGPYDVTVDHGSDHELTNYRRLIEAVGVRTGHRPALHLRDDPGSPLGEPYAVFHLWPGGSNFEERSWPEASWEQLARACNERGLTAVLTGGPGDAAPSERIVAEWTPRGIRARSIAGTPPAEALVWLVHAAGVVSVNTGVMHVAAAAGAPTIALNGPTSGRRWGPVGPHTRCVASPMVPEGYLDLGFERDDRYRDCMAAITVDAVLAAWDDLQAEVARPHRSGSGDAGYLRR
jgi:ADP-heptose:LPS heptosyltransferase